MAAAPPMVELYTTNDIPGASNIVYRGFIMVNKVCNLCNF